jgi:hypothetical protein
MRQPFQLYPSSSARSASAESEEAFSYNQKMRQIIFLAIVLGIVTIESYLLVSCYEDNRLLNETIAEKERIISKMPNMEEAAEVVIPDLVKSKSAKAKDIISESPPIKAKTRKQRPATKRESFANGYGRRN